MVIAEQASKWVPIVWQVFLDYTRDAVQLSRVEVEIVRALMSSSARHALKIASEDGWLTMNDTGTLLANRERSEPEVKLTKLGLPIPWNN